MGSEWDGSGAWTLSRELLVAQQPSPFLLAKERTPIFLSQRTDVAVLVNYGHSSPLPVIGLGIDV